VTALFAGSGWFSGCGYPGEPLPPALRRPVRVADLAVVERGSKVYVQFSVPSITTEGLPIKGRPDIELRVGPMPADGFTFPKWEKASDRVLDSTIHVDNSMAAAEIDASKLYGRTVVIAVRVHGPHGQDVGWSRPETLDLILPLPVPEGLSPTDAPDAIRLDWHAGAPEFRIFRKAPEDAAFRQIGSSDKPSYSDNTIEYGKTYQYLVQSVEKTGERYAESEPSATVTFKPVDKFPPAVPVGLTAIPASRNIELVWDRDTERDLASYQVYRDGKKIAEGLTAPAYSDKDVKPGVRYRYQVLAVDTAGNSSELCAPVETAIP
jgi:hypothetical protein